MGMIECNNVEGINNLRNAVVICAVQDWNSAMKIMNRKGIDKNSDRYKNAEKTRDEVEKFFKSKRFSIFSSLDGAELLSMVKAQFYSGKPINMPKKFYGKKDLK